MATTALMSKKMSIYIDSSILGLTTDFSLSAQKDLIEVTPLGGVKSYVPDTTGWGVSFGGFVPSKTSIAGGEKSVYDLMNTMLNTDTSVSIFIKPDVSTQTYYSGWGYLTSISMDGGVGSAMTFKGEIQGVSTLNTLTT